MAKKNLGPEARMDGIFDWLRGAFRRMAPPVPGLPPAEPRGLVPRREELPAPPRAEERPSFLSMIVPPGALVPRPREAPLIFAPFKPSLPAPPPSAPEAPALWRTLFAPPAPEEAQPPVAEMFAPFAPPEPAVPVWPPAAVAPVPPWGLILGPARPWGEAVEWTREFPDIAARTGGRMPLWVAFNVGWAIPETLSLVEGLRMTWDLPMIFEQALVSVELPEWGRRVADSAHTGEPARLEIEPIGSRYDPYGDLARFFGVPDALVERYAASPEGAEMLSSEVIEPLLARFTKAMDVLKPRPLRGWFEIEPSFDGNFWLKYKEVLHRPETA